LKQLAKRGSGPPRGSSFCSHGADHAVELVARRKCASRAVGGGAT
jgi:hypothetical protein